MKFEAEQKTRSVNQRAKIKSKGVILNDK